MVKLYKNIYLIIICFFVFLIEAFVFADNYPSPAKEIQSIIDRVVQIVKKNKDTNIRRKKLKELIEPYFNFKYMARSSLGHLWDNLNKDQQDRFVKAFSKLLAKTYLGRIEEINQRSVKIDKEIVRFPRALVKTTVYYEKTSFPIDYKLKFIQGKWIVYDVLIESIGLISNYRSEFASIARKEGLDKLVAIVEQKAE